MKFNWRSFVFSLGVLLFALIAVNLMTSGVKLEGFQEGATPLEDKCSKKLSDKKIKISELKKDIDNRKKDVWNGNNIDYKNKLPKYASFSGNCDEFIKDYAKSTQPKSGAKVVVPPPAAPAKKVPAKKAPAKK